MQNFGVESNQAPRVKFNLAQQKLEIANAILLNASSKISRYVYSSILAACIWSVTRKKKGKVRTL